MLNAIDWPGYGCPVRKYTNKKVCHRTRTSVQLPRATTPGVSRQADSRRVRLFEGKQLIIGDIARTPSFVMEYSTGSERGRRPRSQVTHACVFAQIGSRYRVRAISKFLCYRLNINILGTCCDYAAIYRCDIF